ncbi:hypothetical protein MSG28_011821 [Choristoneura fumiferana]|uniref:Uncharacterized protein n=1 Tax=Choristoneura fumiferana TaxID=7141 RepID=A0ACC0KLV0_CHOFU|nr:hypothetical protein MSG28_011821 [Choristoneura fumiferana]
MKNALVPSERAGAQQKHRRGYRAPPPALSPGPAARCAGTGLVCRATTKLETRSSCRAVIPLTLILFNTRASGTDLTGQNSNDSGGSGGAGRASTPHLRPTPSPTGSSGSRSMSPAVAAPAGARRARVARMGALLGSATTPTCRPPPPQHVLDMRAQVLLQVVQQQQY